jgi:thiol:disulfide interchange protein DsbG
MNKIGHVVAAIAATLALVATPARAADAPRSSGIGKPEYQILFTQLEKTDVVQEGAREAKSILYAFFDANCFYCRLTWKALQPYEAAGLQVRWIPVAYQQPSSVGRAAAIMQARDRVAALRKNEIGYDVAHLNGGIPPMDKVPAALVAQLQANTILMQSFGAPGTPALVWKERDGTVRFKLGVPRLSQLPQITRLPEQVIDDPELGRFR